jgi:hypothetical protein
MPYTEVTAAGFISMALALLLPLVPQAQQASGISGIVRDAAGTPIAAVTVETASPALIERIRAAVTDGQGQYQFTNLQPGTYSITFKAAGFITLRTEAVELPASCTAAINGTLKAGSPTETITVTAAVSQVDTRTAAAQSVVSAETTRERASGTGAAQAAVTGLNRAPSACATNSSPNCVVATVPLIQPGTMYETRRNQLDLRFNKTLQLTRKTLFTFNVGLYNVLNKNDVISIQTTYGLAVAEAGESHGRAPSSTQREAGFLKATAVVTEIVPRSDACSRRGVCVRGKGGYPCCA